VKNIAVLVFVENAVARKILQAWIGFTKIVEPFFRLNFFGCV
jgi:hypothetical protein